MGFGFRIPQSYHCMGGKGGRFPESKLMPDGIGTVFCLDIDLDIDIDIDIDINIDFFFLLGGGSCYCGRFRANTCSRDIERGDCRAQLLRAAGGASGVLFFCSGMDRV